jgi:hypothetical protein
LFLGRFDSFVELEKAELPRNTPYWPLVGRSKCSTSCGITSGNSSADSNLKFIYQRAMPLGH